jgi:hypothetical protein
MFKSILIAGAASLLFCGFADAQKLDANGRCHDAKGQFAKAEVCGVASTKATPAKSSQMAMAKSSSGAASATAAATPASATAKAKPVKCKDAKGKFAKCDAPGAHPV